MLRRSLRALVLVAALAAVTSCSSGSDAKGPTATVTSSKPSESTTTTAKPKTPEEEVEAAYLKSWDVYAKAMRTLDGSAYEGVYASEALDLRRRELADLKAKNTPAQMRVDHDYTVTVLAADRAVVVDSYRNHSVLLDANSGHPIESDPNNVLRRKYDLRKEDGRWLIVRVTSLS